MKFYNMIAGTVRGIKIVKGAKRSKMIKFKNNEYQCSLELTLALIGGKWKALILWHLGDRTLRYSEVRRTIQNVTPKMLTQQLRELEDSGLVKRYIYTQIPPKVEYSLTQAGKSLLPLLDAMCKWGQNYAREYKPIEHSEEKQSEYEIIEQSEERRREYAPIEQNEVNQSEYELIEQSEEKLSEYERIEQSEERQSEAKKTKAKKSKEKQNKSKQRKEKKLKETDQLL